MVSQCYDYSNFLSDHMVPVFSAFESYHVFFTHLIAIHVLLWFIPFRLNLPKYHGLKNTTYIPLDIDV